MARTRSSSQLSRPARTPAVRPLRKAELKRAEQLWCLAYHVEDDGERTWMMGRTRLADCCGVEADGEIAAVGRLLPMKVTLGGRAISFGAVASLATAVQSRRRGHIQAIIVSMLGDMRKRGMVLSGLYPFDSGFYRRYGWAIADTTCNVALPTRMLAVRGRSPGRIVPVPVARATTLRPLHTAFGDRYNLSQRRDAWWYRHYMARSFFSFYRYDNAAGTPEGYVALRFEPLEPAGQRMLVRELVATTAAARTALLAFLGDFDSQAKQVDFLMPASDPLFAQLRNFDHASVRHSYDYTAMMRIVDVAGLLRGCKDLAGADGHVTVQVEDEFAPWNQGAWRVSIKAGVSSVSKSNQAADCAVSIQTLTQLVTGYLTPDNAVFGELVTGPHPERIALVHRFAGGRTPFHNDMY